jgi:hypothetical protein
MKKLVTILTIIIITKFQATSQTLDSLIGIPASKLRIAINLIEKGKVTQEELDLTKEKVKTLEQRVVYKDSMIYRYGQKDIYWNKLDSNHNIQINNLKQVVDNDMNIFHIQANRIRNQKRQKWLYLLLGATSTYFITKH